MGKAIYIDCFSGVSGNMLLGALLDAGLSLDQLNQELGKLGLPNWEIVATREMRQMLAGTHVEVKIGKETKHRRLPDIRQILQVSTLDVELQERAIGIFTALARSEARVHGMEPESVHFHEVGAVDAIIDIVGFVIGLDLLGITQVFASALPLGSGWIRAAHGWLPVPGPAVLYLLEAAQAPIRSDDTQAELVTPTGAAILTALAEFRRPAITFSKVGFGLGTRRLERPNALCVWIGNLQPADKEFMQQRSAFSRVVSRGSQGKKVSSAAPMGSAPMHYTEEGQVAWDQMWTDFCDLAVDGGPPHRGDLLEPVSLEEIHADPEGYERAVREIERGFSLVAPLASVKSTTPGWVGLACEDEEMALWMLQAIIPENVSVRREGQNLFLPAGPAFEIEKEIKNVITVVAKTYHYWSEHL